MTIAVIGYGRMGKEIVSILKQRGHDYFVIDPKVNNADYAELTEEMIKKSDVVIDFTLPDTALDNIDLYLKAAVPSVIGTTGWYEHIDDVKNKVEASETGLIWAANFSVGVNLFYRIVRNASKIMNRVSEYDAFIHEFHHMMKADSPSGTARMLSNILLAELDNKEKAVFEMLPRRIEEQELHVSSTRSGSIPGTHTVGFDSSADSIELTHRARNRGGFALGAVLAAEFVKGKKGFFGIDDLMNELV